LHCEWSGERTNKTAEREGGKEAEDRRHKESIGEEKRRRQSERGQTAKKQSTTVTRKLPSSVADHRPGGPFGEMAKLRS
jgi:hypothetical protein